MPTWGTGKYGTAVNLDGSDDFVDLGNPASAAAHRQHDGQRLGVLGGISRATMRRSCPSAGHDSGTSSTRPSTAGPRTIGFKLTNSSGGDMFRYGATAMQLNTWYHVAGVYDAAARTMNVYLNGQLDNGGLVGTVTASQQNSTAERARSAGAAAQGTCSTAASTTCASTTAPSAPQRSRPT